MKSAVGSSKRAPVLGVMLFCVVALGITWASYAVGDAARRVFLAQEEEIFPIIAGGVLDEIPALMRGDLPSVASSMAKEVGRREKPPRMCEMPADFFDELPRGANVPRGMTSITPM